MGAQLRSQRGIVDPRIPWHHVRHQSPALSVARYDDCSLCHCGVAAQHCFDFCRFDAVTIKLDLLIQSPETR